MSLTLVKKEMQTHVEVAQKSLDELSSTLHDVAKAIIKTLKNGKKLLICGNGGSAADSQHFAAELTGRYKRERKGIKAIALSTDTSALTAIANDYGYEYVFSRQAEALLDEGDILFGISTSGNSKNVINAFETANRIGCLTISLTGRDGGKMKSVSDYNIIIPSNDTPRIQEMHILCIHILCEIIERNFMEKIEQ
ncbi:D-sedoheptulose 7-phosphate isomerase [Helicobacter didelphidarum]|uniref:Phosphoheptose isomerase n=1 Tax=Helicobacter didelphidarum TaxID=2040648 RepID=A0A3D8IQC1_9HELI|nr:D-sedoheptulose 7-phosphate isomerase [Helicobacter didelphidarum]RDU67469.1 D-sedoheptulose 7-phosphate isomerase [Helicobacter didelphidarum]